MFLKRMLNLLNLLCNFEQMNITELFEYMTIILKYSNKKLAFHAFVFVSNKEYTFEIQQWLQTKKFTKIKSFLKVPSIRLLFSFEIIPKYPF